MASVAAPLSSVGLTNFPLLFCRLRHREAVVYRIAVLDVTDCARTLLDQRGDAFVALSARAHWEGYGFVGADFVGPILAYRGEVLREDERGATSIRTGTRH